MQLYQKIKDIFTGRTNVKENSNNSKSDSIQNELVNSQPIKNTPFHIVGNTNQGYFLGLGKYRLTENFKHKTQVEQYLNENMWTVVLNTAMVVVEMGTQNQDHKENQTQKNGIKYASRNSTLTPKTN